MSSRILIALALASLAGAQSLTVYSEFQRVDSLGKIVAADRGAEPREILSPAAARGAFASFHVAVSVPPGTSFTLYVGQNPEDAVRVTLYKELYEQHGGEWIPDKLEHVELPYAGQLEMAGQTTQAFWMDMWVDADSPVRRIKVEPQLNVGGHWVTYPMEVRVMAATVPEGQYPAGPAPAVDAPADSAALGVLASYVCGGEQPHVVAGGTRIGELSARNAWQDMALASNLPKETLWSWIGAADRKAWCRAPSHPPDAGAEWYLRIRDRLFQPR